MMNFRIADSFTDALTRLSAQNQKTVKNSAFDLQFEPSGPGLQFHRPASGRTAVKVINHFGDELVKVYGV